MELNDRVAIVTGGAVRIGRALTLALAEAGVKVVVHYGNSAEAAAETVAAARERGAAAVTVEADLRRPQAAAEKIMAAAIQEFGRADILVNSAALFEADTLASVTPELWERQFAVNLQAPFWLCQAFAGRLAPGQRGHIVNIVDWRALRPGPDHLVYTLTKAALAALTLSLAQHLAPQVQVNAIAPGAILPATDGSAAEFERLAGRVPLQRTGAPHDIAAALLFLLRSEFVTGEIVHVTGGQHL